jgi:hypothetical protein
MRNYITCALLQVEEDEIGTEYSMHGEKRNAYRILMVKPAGKRPLRKPTRRREDNLNRILQR